MGIKKLIYALFLIALPLAVFGASNSFNPVHEHSPRPKLKTRVLVLLDQNAIPQTLQSLEAEIKNRSLDADVIFQQPPEDSNKSRYAETLQGLVLQSNPDFVLSQDARQQEVLNDLKNAQMLPADLQLKRTVSEFQSLDFIENPKADPFREFVVYPDKKNAPKRALVQSKDHPYEKKTMRPVQLSPEQRKRLGMQEGDIAFMNYAMADGTFRIAVLNPEFLKETRIVLEPWDIKVTSVHSNMLFRMKPGHEIRIFPQTVETFSGKELPQSEKREDLIFSLEGVGAKFNGSGPIEKTFAMTGSNLFTQSVGVYPVEVRGKEGPLAIKEDLDPGPFDNYQASVANVRTLPQYGIKVSHDVAVKIFQSAILEADRRGGKTYFKTLTGNNCASYSMCSLKMGLGKFWKADISNVAPGLSPWSLKWMGILDEKVYPPYEQEPSMLPYSKAFLEAAGFGGTPPHQRITEACGRLFSGAQ